MKAGAQQVKTIHVLKSKLRIDDASYRAILGSYGVKSSLDLQSAAARELIRVLVNRAQKAGVWNQKQKRWDTLGERPGMAVPAQLRKIEVMWAEVSRAPTAATKQAALRVFLENQFGISALEWVTQEMVGKIVRTLQAMRKTKEKRNASDTDSRNTRESNGVGIAVDGSDGQVQPDIEETGNSEVQHSTGRSC